MTSIHPCHRQESGEDVHCVQHTYLHRVRIREFHYMNRLRLRPSSGLCVLWLSTDSQKDSSEWQFIIRPTFIPCKPQHVLVERQCSLQTLHYNCDVMYAHIHITYRLRWNFFLCELRSTRSCLLCMCSIYSVTTTRERGPVRTTRVPPLQSWCP